MSARPIHHGFLACVLTACSAGAPQKPSVAVLPRDWLADIRAQAAQADSAVQVVPLLDPGVADLRQQTQTLESQGQLAQAVERWEQAIHLLPNDPELWQSLAETRIAQQRWREAEQAARLAGTQQRQQVLDPQEISERLRRLGVDPDALDE